MHGGCLSVETYPLNCESHCCLHKDGKLLLKFLPTFLLKTGGLILIFWYSLFYNRESVDSLCICRIYDGADMALKMPAHSRTIQFSEAHHVWSAMPFFSNFRMAIPKLAYCTNVVLTRKSDLEGPCPCLQSPVCTDRTGNKTDDILQLTEHSMIKMKWDVRRVQCKKHLEKVGTKQVTQAYITPFLFRFFPFHVNSLFQLGNT